MTRIQTKDVVATAAIVPVGIALDASAKSPDRFEPAIIPDNKTSSTVSHNSWWNTNNIGFTKH